MKKVFFTVLCYFVVMSLSAQKNKGFSSQFSAGLLEGEAGSALQFQSVNGYRYNTWFTGIGLGLDYYYKRSIPLFLSIQKDLLNKPRTLYFSLDGGTNFNWEKEEGNRFNNFISTEYKPQLYWAGGLGYKFGLRNRDAFFLNLAYSFKHLREVRETPTMCLNPPCDPNIEQFDYRLKRLSLRLGYMF